MRKNPFFFFFGFYSATEPKLGKNLKIKHLIEFSLRARSNIICERSFFPSPHSVPFPFKNKKKIVFGKGFLALTIFIQPQCAFIYTSIILNKLFYFFRKNNRNFVSFYIRFNISLLHAEVNIYKILIITEKKRKKKN